MRVSIITPSLNQGRFIEDNLRSVASQTYPDVEHVVVDAGSTDETIKVLRRHADRPNLRWSSEKDEGQADGIEKGFRFASGELLTWLNADDVYLDPHVVEKVVSTFRSRPGTELVTGGGVFLTEEGEVDVPISPPADASYEALRYRDVILQPATFFRRRVWESTPFDRSLHYAFDWDFFARAARRYRIEILDEYLAGYRMYGENKTDLAGSRRSLEIAEVTGRLLGRWSWQHVFLRLVAHGDQVLDSLPPSPQAFLRRSLYGVRNHVSLWTKHRLGT